MATVLIDKLLQAAIKQGVSDIHIVVGQPPVFRLHGRMRKLETKTLEAEDTVGLMKSITPERCQRELQEAGSTDFGFAFGDQARFRVSVFKQRGFISMVLRQIPNDKLTPEQLGLPESVVKLVHRPRGLFLVTGPTGSGKSTTLASLINCSTRPSTTTSLRSKTRSSSITTTSRARSISARSASMCRVSRKRFAAPCGKTPT